MIQSDIPTLVLRLNELADALGHKRVSTEGFKVWADVLRDFAIADVVEAISASARSSNRMPAPSDLLKALNDRRSDHLESRAQSAREQFEQEANRTARTESKFSQELKALNKALQKPSHKDSKDWARMIYRRFVAGQTWRNDEAVSGTQIAFACAALQKDASAAYAERDANLHRGLAA